MTISKIVFNNGVFDFTDNRFYEGKMFNKIDSNTLVFSKNYYPVDKLSDYKNMKECIRNWIPNRLERHYFLRVLGAALIGDRHHSHVIYGSGSNGKTTFLRFLKNTLKQYYTQFSKLVFSEESESLKLPTNPELRGIHFSTTFVANPRHESEMHINFNIKYELNTYSELFLSYLVYQASCYIEEDMKLPHYPSAIVNTETPTEYSVLSYLNPFNYV